MAPSDPDRTLAICDLLLGAAHADEHFHDEERETVRELLADLHGGEKLPDALETRIQAFTPTGFDVALTAAPFRGDSIEERRKLLHLVSAIHDADEELDLAEDDYLRALATALELPAEELSGLALEVEVEELRDSFVRLRSTPPPIPAAAREARKPASDGEDVDDVDVKID
jgi:uncharacterized tellurite resistance protein B-like protein